MQKNVEGDNVTICIAVKVHAASFLLRTMVTSDGNGNQAVRRIYDHGHKVFNLIRSRPISAMTCGLGNFGNLSVSTIAKEIRRAITAHETGVDPDSFTIQQVADYCHAHFEDLFNSLPDPVKENSSFTFFVGGYSTNGSGSELWKFQLSGAGTTGIQMLAGEQDCTIEWDGQPDACSRLVLGISPATTGIPIDSGISVGDAVTLTQKFDECIVGPNS